MKKELEGKYVLATCVSAFRQRYLIPAEALQAMNDKMDLDEPLAKQWMEESVGCEEVKEFSQKWLGETVIDVAIIDEPQMLKTFDEDNNYLVEWSEEQKIKFAREWEESSKKP